MSDTVGGDVTRWSAVAVDFNKSGPMAEEMSRYSGVIWYTGGSYGGAHHHTAVLSIADEPNVRRYLEQTGGSFILFSPGFVYGKVMGF